MCLHLQGNRIPGEGGLLMLKSAKRSDSGVYKCEATDFDNLDAELQETINLKVHCK